jgi:hypothetical protein
LDDLLASYGKGDDKGAVAPKEEPAKTSDSDRIAALEERAVRAELENALTTKVVPLVKGDLNLPDDFIRSYAVGKAFEDSRLGKLFDQREAEPEKFEAALKALGKQLANEFEASGSKDDTSEDDRIGNAVRNARNASAKVAGYDNVDWSSLNAEQFELKKRALFKAAERGELRNS